jgi:hypothetical protein
VVCTNSKKFIFVFVILFVALLFVSGCQKKERLDAEENSPAGQNQAQAENFTFIYIINPERVEHNTFSIVKPGDWKETGINNSVIYIPPGGKISDPFSEKMAMTVVFLSENETRSVSQLSALDIEKSREMFPDFQIVQQEANARLGQIDAIRLVFTGTVQNRTLQIAQIRAIQGNRFYAFTLQCEYEKCNQTNVFMEMARTFQWKNP